MAYDCAKPRGPIWKVAWAGVKDKWPGAHAAITAFKITNQEMGAMVAAVDLDGEDLDAVVADWGAENEATWSKWLANQASPWTIGGDNRKRAVEGKMGYEWGD